jgi:hypothetical protein
MKVLEEDEQYKWSQDDVKQAGPDLYNHTIILVYITAERNLRPNMEAKMDTYDAKPHTTIKPEPQYPATP